MFCLYLIINMT